MPKYLRTIFLSFYSSAAYKEALNNWRGYGLKYLLIVTLLTSAIISAGWAWKIKQIDAHQAANTVMGFIISDPNLSFEANINRFLNILYQIPEIRIEEGKTITQEAQPYIIKDPVSGHDFAIIDTTGHYKSLEGTDALLLLTETKFIVKEDDAKETVTYLNKIQEEYTASEESLNDTLFIFAQIPLMRLENGKLLTEGNKLYEILDKDNRKIALIGPDAALGENSTEPLVAINQDEISFKTKLNKEASYIKVKDISEESLSGMIKSGLAYIQNIMFYGVPLIAFPFITAGAFIFNGLMLLLCAFIGYVYIKISKVTQLEYKQIMRIAAVAITPVLIISVVLPHVIPSQGTVYFLIMIGYMYHAIRSVSTV